MKKTVLLTLVMMSSALAGCIGGEEFDSSDLEQQITDLENNQELTNQTIFEMEQTIIAQQNEIDELEASMIVMDQILNNQALINDEIQQALEDMNASNAEDVQSILSSIVEINLNISSSQTAISSLIEELENLNSTNSDLHAQLNATQNYLYSLELYLNTTIVDLISEINWANDTANWANGTLRLPYVDLSYSEMTLANLNGADFRNSDMSYANLDSANLSGANLGGANLYVTSMRFADLSGANLSGAALEFTNLLGANLTGADLSGAYFSGVQWSNTICPDGTNSDDNGNTCENNL